MECGGNTMVIPENLGCCPFGTVTAIAIPKKQPKKPNIKMQEIKRVKYRNPMKHLQPKKNKRKR